MKSLALQLYSADCISSHKRQHKRTPVQLSSRDETLQNSDLQWSELWTSWVGSMVWPELLPLLLRPLHTDAALAVRVTERHRGAAELKQDRRNYESPNIELLRPQAVMIFTVVLGLLSAPLHQCRVGAAHVCSWGVTLSLSKMRKWLMMARIKVWMLKGSVKNFAAVCWKTTSIFFLFLVFFFL